MDDFSTEAQRRRAIAWATALTTGTSLQAAAYEQGLLERYARGELTLAQVLHDLDTRVQHVLYRSQAVQPFTPAQLSALLEEAHAYNQAHAITGLLCYCQGRFVQLIEGEAGRVHALYAKNQRDPRHAQVTTLRDGAGPLRLFPDWRMAYVEVEAGKFQGLLSALAPSPSFAVPEPPLPVPQLPVQDPHLLTLLAAFSQTH